MKKKYLLLFILCLFSSILFSQTKKKETTQSVGAIEIQKSDSKSTSITPVVPSTATVLEKVPLPQSTKSYPEVVYLINDKPVDYRTYVHYLQKNKK